MKWVNRLYYLCVSALTIFLLLMSIALPVAFIFVIPVCGYLYAFPKLRVNKVPNDKMQSDKLPDDAVPQNETTESKQDNFELEKQEYGKQIQTLLDEKQELNQKLEILCENINNYKALLRMSVSTMDGTVFEQYVGYRLLEAGYRNIQFTVASGDFGADIIAFDNEGKKVCFQCKRYSEPVGVAAVQQITSARIYYESARAAVVTNSTFTPAAKELAAKTGVELMERFI